MDDKYIFELKLRLQTEFNRSGLVDKAEDIFPLFFAYPSTLRLTKMGMVYFKAAYTPHTFELDIASLRSAHVITLANQMSFPYYISPTFSHLILFSEYDSTAITLVGGVPRFLEIHTK